MKTLIIILFLFFISCNNEINIIDCVKHGDYWIGVDKEENMPIICKSKKGGLNEE